MHRWPHPPIWLRVVSKFFRISVVVSPTFIGGRFKQKLTKTRQVSHGVEECWTTSGTEECRVNSVLCEDEVHGKVPAPVSRSMLHSRLVILEVVGIGTPFSASAHTSKAMLSTWDTVSDLGALNRGP